MGWQVPLSQSVATAGDSTVDFEEVDGPMEDERPFSQQSSRVVEQAIEVVFAIAENTDEHIGVRELSRRLGISRSTTHRILVALRKGGVVSSERGSLGYVPGPRLSRLSNLRLRQGDLVSAARPHLQELWRLSGETAVLSVRTYGMRVTLDQLDSPQELRVTTDIGVGSPLYAGAAARVLLAFMPDSERDAYLARTDLRLLTSATMSTRAELLASLEESRRLGYAISCGERVEGGASIAAPIIRDQACVASVSIFGPKQRVCDDAERLIPEVIRTAALIQKEFHSAMSSSN